LANSNISDRPNRAGLHGPRGRRGERRSVNWRGQRVWSRFFVTPAARCANAHQSNGEKRQSTTKTNGWPFSHFSSPPGAPRGVPRPMNPPFPLLSDPANSSMRCMAGTSLAGYLASGGRARNCSGRWRRDSFARDGRFETRIPGDFSLTKTASSPTHLSARTSATTFRSNACESFLARTINAGAGPQRGGVCRGGYELLIALAFAAAACTQRVATTPAERAPDRFAAAQLHANCRRARAGDRLVGRTQFCPTPAVSPRAVVVGGALDANFERILDSNPISCSCSKR